MAWTTPPTFTAGTVLTAAHLNILSDDLTYLKGITDGVSFSGAQVTRNANQSISTSTDTNVSWDTENLDYGGWYSSGTAVTVPAGAIPSGYTSIAILVTASVKFTTNGTGGRKIAALKNGTSFGSWRVSALSDDSTSIYLTEVTTVVAGDTIAVQVWQNSGSALNMTQARLSVLRYAPAA